MKSYFIFLISILLLYCSSKKNKQETDNDGKGITLGTVFPVLNLDSSKKMWVVQRYDTFTTTVFIYKGYLCLQKNHYIRQINKREEFETKEYRSVTGTFFIADSSKYAIYFDTINSPIGRIVNKDSLLKTSEIFNLDKNPFFKENETRLILSITIPGDTLLQKYSFKNKLDTTLTGSAEFTLIDDSTSVFPEIGFKSIEQKTGHRVTKAIFVINERKDPGSDYAMGKIILPYQLKEFKLENDSLINAMYKKAKALLKQ